MAQLRLPPEPEKKHTVYGDFGGADFSQDPSLVDKRRSPMPLNMISDNGGNPVKRKGWRTVLMLDKPINGIWEGEIEGISHFLVHGGTKLYRITVTNGVYSSATVYTGLNSAKSNGFFFRISDNSRFFIQTGTQYMVYDGTQLQPVSAIAKIPTVITGRKPTGGGTVLEPVNLVQPKRTDSFLGNTTDKIYQLTSTNLDATPVTARKRNSSGGWDDMTEGNQFTVNRTTGQATFTSVMAPVVEGQDNVEITYAKTIDGYADRINKCTIFALYGVRGNNRVFLAGNPNYKANDWYSGIFDPTYFGDTNYIQLGTNDTAIMGHSKIGEYLGVTKEDNQQDITTFLVYGEFADNKTTFKVKTGIAGIGAISKNCFANLKDEPLFFTRTGIFAITSTLLSYERTLRNRSYFVDRKLTREPNLESAIACVYNGYYVLTINGNCYIMDSRKSTGDKSGNSNYLYECYYWENVPAVCMTVVDNDIYFGTELGNLCKFNFDFEIEDMTAYNDDNKPIIAQWATPNDNDDNTQLFKNLSKKGTMVTISPYLRSSGKVYFVVDGNPEAFIRSQYMDIFDWRYIDFERFTFNSNTSPQEIYFKKKIKKYKRLQIVIRNDELNEAFGIHEIVKTYSYGNYSKNRGGS